MTNRRAFLTTTSTAILGLATSKMIHAKESSIAVNRGILKPKRLKKGATIGLIAPGYSVSEEQLQNAINQVKALGMQPYYTQSATNSHGYFSDTDAERAKDLMHMFTNPKVDGIFCIRGGYGCTRILDLLDYELIAQNPKVLVGYSDVTALLNVFYQKTGLVGFHGAMGAQPNSYAIKQLEHMVMNPNVEQKIENFHFDEEQIAKDATYEQYTITKGTAEGILIGGNLSLLAAMNGTDYQIDYTDKIVCIEDIGERPYRIDRMLTQLLSTPSFKKARGIVFGISKDCDKKEGSDSFSLKEVILDRIAQMEIPAVYGMSFGHLEENFTFPIGINARLDADAFALTLLENPIA